MQALVEHKGKQFLVEENLELKLPFLGGKEGDKINIEKVLYVDDSKKKTFGSPYIENLSITGKILSHVLGYVNIDNIVNVVDIVFMVSIIMDNTETSSEQFANADLDGNLLINVADIVALVNIIIS